MNLLESIFLDDIIEKLPAGAVFQDKKNFVLGFDFFVKSANVGMLQRSQRFDFCFNSWKICS